MVRIGAPISICFIAPTAWPVLSHDRAIGTAGGAEVQQCTLARVLVDAGFAVSMICMDYGQADATEVDGVTVYKAHSPTGGIPLVRFIYPRLTSIWQAMRRANADIYYQRAAGVQTGWGAAYCKSNRRQFVYAVASDMDLDPAVPVLPMARDRLIYKYGLRNTDAIIVQSDQQRQQCRLRLGRDAVLIPSCYRPPATACSKRNGYILWVATPRRLKRPDLFLDLAEQMPQYQFRIVGGSDVSAYYQSIEARARQLRNVQWVGFVPYPDIESQFDGARLLINTSDAEGFPNTFLQAWARGVPTVSFVQPAERLNDGPVPLCVRTFGEMKQSLQLLMEDDHAWERTGQFLQDKFRACHSVETVGAAYAELLVSLASKVARDT